mmetsp:Transcript_8178/g.7772  ORF Transcript_8178/g.7772 Transcript_8178/m.7772 type:complete len:102 (-) Transcript_8178:318-623(-)
MTILNFGVYFMILAISNTEFIPDYFYWVILGRAFAALAPKSLAGICAWATDLDENTKKLKITANGGFLIVQIVFDIILVTFLLYKTDNFLAVFGLILFFVI